MDDKDDFELKQEYQEYKEYKEIEAKPPRELEDWEIELAASRAKKIAERENRKNRQAIAVGIVKILYWSFLFFGLGYVLYFFSGIYNI